MQSYAILLGRNGFLLLTGSQNISKWDTITAQLLTSTKRYSPLQAQSRTTTTRLVIARFPAASMRTKYKPLGLCETSNSA
jgi:hypothetical protein